MGKPEVRSASVGMGEGEAGRKGGPWVLVHYLGMVREENPRASFF